MINRINQVVMAFSVLPPLVGEVSSSIYVALQLFELIDRTPLINDSGGLMLPAERHIPSAPSMSTANADGWDGIQGEASGMPTGGTGSKGKHRGKFSNEKR